ncbi:hypothetical protein VSS74_24100 [Conexibacter stalactiti]|uniref:Uncharacterized protein n=1 Tax=Conexibacter stalactiti TaxID=1940611 RepID=A0ABU4HVV1_9ACTN|nr:hypothetical protein [Conexibacter stalactiti]MDW5597453.1 hypothetical protein [Conexibacter stalactiti]MEC5038095.1 hypothetical protein [Conexibacter stalactiti]
MSRRTSLASFAGICLAAVTTTALVTSAHATTGVGTGLPQPRVDVAKADGEQFVGRYSIGEIDRRAKVTSGQLMIDYTDTEKPFLIGSLAIYGFDRDGRQQTSAAITYPFSFADDVLTGRVISQGTYRQIGSIRLPVPRSTEELSGTLGWRGGTYQVVFDRLPVSDLATALPQAKQIDAVPLRLKNRGLGARDSAFYGRWELVPSRDDVGKASSLYAPLVRAATAVSDDELVPDSGHLQLFEVESRFDPPAPGGMMTLHAPGSTRAEFLTDFRWEGPWRTAIVRGGSDGGPVVGRFTGRVSGDTLVGTLRNGDLSIELTFTRPKQR